MSLRRELPCHAVREPLSVGDDTVVEVRADAETVSEPIAIAKTQRITNVRSAETSASRIRIGSRSKRAAMRATNREGERRKP